jgi:hypothetical protein
MPGEKALFFVNEICSESGMFMGFFICVELNAK